MPILLVTFGGLIILTAVLTRKQVLTAAERIAGGRKRLSASTIPLATSHVKFEGEERVHILSGGGTIFNYGDIVSHREFKKENEKALGRGKRPAVGQIKKDGRWVNMPQTIEPPEEARYISCIRQLIKWWKKNRRDIERKDFDGIVSECFPDKKELLGFLDWINTPRGKELWGRWLRFAAIQLEDFKLPCLVNITKGEPSEFDLFPDSPEYLAHTVDMTGWRQKMDQSFQGAIARVRSSGVEGASNYKVAP